MKKWGYLILSIGWFAVFIFNIWCMFRFHNTIAPTLLSVPLIVAIIFLSNGLYNYIKCFKK